MDAFYELIHLPSGNVVGDYESQGEALLALRRITDGEPTAPVTDFALVRGDGDDQTLVAMRDDLRTLIAASAEPARLAG